MMYMKKEERKEEVIIPVTYKTYIIVDGELKKVDAYYVHNCHNDNIELMPLITEYSKIKK